MYRVYFWISGAPHNRPGGPWWYRDFNFKSQAEIFINDMGPVCRTIKLLIASNDYPELPNHPVMQIVPPKEAETIWHNGELLD